MQVHRSGRLNSSPGENEFSAMKLSVLHDLRSAIRAMRGARIQVQGPSL